MFCIYLRTNSDLCHLQQKLIGFYNRDEKCLQRGTNRVFKWSSLRFVFKGLIWRQVHSLYQKRVLHSVPSSAFSFSLGYRPFSLRSSSSCWRLLHSFIVLSNFPWIFPSVIMWSVQLALLCCIAFLYVTLFISHTIDPVYLLHPSAASHFWTSQVFHSYHKYATIMVQCRVKIVPLHAKLPQSEFTSTSPTIDTGDKPRWVTTATPGHFTQGKC